MISWQLILFLFHYSEAAPPSTVYVMCLADLGGEIVTCNIGLVIMYLNTLKEITFGDTLYNFCTISLQVYDSYQNWSLYETYARTLYSCSFTNNKF